MAGGSKKGERRGGRKKGTPNKRTQDVQDTLQRLGCNPIEGMALLAIGDVVRLGYMTQKEVDEPAQFDDEGHVIRYSGMERALSYVPPKLRAEMYAELAAFVAPKRKAVEISSPNSDAVRFEMILEG